MSRRNGETEVMAALIASSKSVEEYELKCFAAGLDPKHVVDLLWKRVRKEREFGRGIEITPKIVYDAKYKWIIRPGYTDAMVTFWCFIDSHAPGAEPDTI